MLKRCQGSKTTEALGTHPTKQDACQYKNYKNYIQGEKSPLKHQSKFI